MLRQPVPYAVRRAVLARSNGHCEDCGSTLKRLELHHLTYRRDGYTIFGREQPSDLAALCRDCHHARHLDRNGRFWSNPQTMAAYWKQEAVPNRLRLMGSRHRRLDGGKSDAGRRTLPPNSARASRPTVSMIRRHSHRSALIPWAILIALAIGVYVATRGLPPPTDEADPGQRWTQPYNYNDGRGAASWNDRGFDYSDHGGRRR
jgi:hypothetical protein